MLQSRWSSSLGAGLFVMGAVAGLLSSCSSSDDASKSAADDASTTSGTTDAVEADRLLSVGDGKVLATLDPRFQSYNIEMVEVTGGVFWSDYDAADPKIPRDPVDLANPRLRNLAQALGPAYVRVSGTWANSTYFDMDGSSGGVPPEGFGGVLTAEQWQGVGDFAEALDGEIVTSFASNVGVRDGNGVWVGDQARDLMQFSIDNDIPLVAAEFYNEPSLNIGVPSGYDIDAFGRDFAIFTELADEVMPDLMIVGPGAAEDVTPLVFDPPLAAEDMLEAVGPSFDAFSYHFYPKVSERCGSKEGPEVALTQEFLSRVEVDRDYYEGLRDAFEPDAPMWVTETAQAACGGDRWAATYLDVIRYVDQLGRLAHGDGDVVFHNTLAASDYGLIDENGFEPRPNYWAAVLWQQLMGPEVLEVEAKQGVDDLAVYAQCTPDPTGDASVTYAVVNSSATEARTVAAESGDATLYLLTGAAFDGGTISLNGTVLEAAADGTVPELVGEAVTGTVEIPPASVAFVVEATGTAACA